jgi:NAD-dependent SIR2 family protein deacetylase
MGEFKDSKTQFTASLMRLLRGHRNVKYMICDGCGRTVPAQDLEPIGDGTLRVCPRCYPIAVLMVRTSQLRPGGDTASA